MSKRNVVCALFILLAFLCSSCQKEKQTLNKQGSALQLEELKGLNDSLLKDLYASRVEQGKKDEAAALSLVLGNRSRSKGDYQAAMDYHQNALDVALRAKNYLLAANAYNNLGTDARRLQAMALAHNYYLKALSLLQKYPCSDENSDCLDVRSHNNNGLGNLYLDMGETEQAKFFFNRALEIAQSRQDHIALAINYANLGAIAEHEKQDSLAMTLFLKSLENNRLSNNEKGIALCFGLLGRLYEKMDQERMAMLSYQSAYEQLLHHRDKWHRLQTIMPLLRYYQRVGNEAEFNLLMQEGKELANSIQAPYFLYQIEEMLAKQAEAKGKYKEALEHTHQSQELRQLSSSTDSTALSTVLRLQYDQQMAHEQVSFYENESILSNQKLVFLEQLLILSMFILTLITIALVLLWRNHRRKMNLIKEKDAQRMAFMELISDDIMSPLTLISALNKRISSPDTKLEDLRKDVRLLNSQERNVQQLITQVMEYARLTLSAPNAQKKSLIDVVGYSRMACEPYFNLAAKKGVHCNFSSDINSLYTHIYLPYLDGLISNLLNNFILFSETGDNINCTINDRSYKGVFQFSFWSNATGLTDKDLSNIMDFDVLTNPDFSDSNVGLRFYLCSQYVQSLMAEVVVQGQQDDESGLSISISLPVGTVRNRELHALRAGKQKNELLNSVGKIHESLRLDNEEAMQSEGGSEARELNNVELIGEKIQSQKSHVLLLDNDKQMGIYFKKMLEIDYKVTVIRELEAAKTFVAEQLPDLVISNVRLPAHNGLELVEYMRSLSSCKNIPVITISASKSGDERIRSIKIGAQVHLEMPFDSEELLTQVASLLDSALAMKTSRLSEIFQGNLHSELSNKEAVDFMIQLSDIINNNLSNDKLGPNYLAERLNLSVSSLNRKLNLLTGYSCKAFITSLRIENSKQKLRDTDMSVADIAALNGFYDLPHFSRTFKNSTGSTPSDYRKVSRLQQLSENNKNNKNGVHKDAE